MPATLHLADLETIQRRNLVLGQLQPVGVTHPAILAAFEAVPRTAFLPSALQAQAYIETCLPLPTGGHMLPAPEHAKLLQAIAWQGHERVLAVGDDSGYGTAILLQLAKHVTSFASAEALKNLQKNLQAYGQNINKHAVLSGDVAKGPDVAALKASKTQLFDVVVLHGQVVPAVAAAYQTVLKPNGQLLCVQSQNNGASQALLYRFAGTSFTPVVLFDAAWPPLIGAALPSVFVL